MSGPFEGMSYVDHAVGSVLLPKLMGTYERELAAVIARLRDSAPVMPIVVGAAEGYYAVGLARWSCVQQVLAFEAVEHAHDAMRQLARKNGVAEKLSIRGLCDCTLLNGALNQCSDTQPVLIVDIEGAESILLDPVVVPRLRKAILLIEMHDAFVPGLAERMAARFGASHHIERFDAQDRTFADLPPALLPLPAGTQKAAVYAMNEGRVPGMYWWFMSPLVDGQSSPQAAQPAAAS